MHAVEKSGSATMERMTLPRPVGREGGPFRRLLKWGCFFTARAAVQMMMAILASSEGWNRPYRSNQPPTGTVDPRGESPLFQGG